MARVTIDLIDRLLARWDQLDPYAVQGYILKLVREKGVLESIFKVIHEGVIIINRNLTFEYVNRAAKEMLGLPDDITENKNLTIARFFRDIDWTRIMNQDPQEWQRASRYEVEVFYPTHRFLLFYLIPYRNELDPENRTGMAVIILHDITELRNRAQNDIERERINAISMLAAGVAHEIGNPLNSLQIHLQLLERYLTKLPENEETNEAIENVNVCLREVNRLDKIIFSFLKAVRPKPLELELVLLSKLIEETLTILEPEIRDREIQVVCQFLEEEPRIHVDVSQIKQAFYNIIKNAIQAMSSMGVLTIIEKITEKGLLVEFHDTGEGIPPEEIGNIFHPYYTTREHGTGLGLVIVERIVREHGAELNLESEQGKGTVVSIHFPFISKWPRLLEAATESVILEATAVETKEDTQAHDQS